MTRGTKPEMLSAAPDKGIACSGRQHECIVSYSWSGDLPLPPLPLQANPGPFAFGGLPITPKWPSCVIMQWELLSWLWQLLWLGMQEGSVVCWHAARQLGLLLVLSWRPEEILNKYSLQEGKCQGSDLIKILIPEGNVHHVGLSKWDTDFRRFFLMTLFMFIFQCCGSSQELWTKCLLTLGLYKHRLKGWSCSGKLSLFGKLTSELMLFYLNWASKIYSECLFFQLGSYLSLSLCPVLGHVSLTFMDCGIACVASSFPFSSVCS